MIEKFLKAKHWQLFLATLGVGIISTILLIIVLSTFHNYLFIVTSIIVYVLLMSISCLVFYGWLWSVVIGLQSVIKEEYKMNILKFKICFFIPILYTVILLFYFCSVGFVLFMKPVIDYIILPLQIFLFIVQLYTLYFAAKTIRTAETQRKAMFDDFMLEVILLLFFPIGLWAIQPKINQIINKQEQSLNSINISNLN